MEQEASSSPKPKKGNMTNQKLLEGMDSVEAFDKMYMVREARFGRGSRSLTHVYAFKRLWAHVLSRAMMWASDREQLWQYTETLLAWNSMWWLTTTHVTPRSLNDFMHYSTRDKLDEAVRIYESVIWRYGEQDWGSIENSLLIKCADSQRRLGKIDQYIESLLTLLKNTNWLTVEEATRYTEELLSNVHKLDTGNLHKLHVSSTWINFCYPIRFTKTIWAHVLNCCRHSHRWWVNSGKQ